MIPCTRLQLISSFNPAISIVPPNRKALHIGVTASRASVKIAHVLGNCLGFASVML